MKDEKQIVEEIALAICESRGVAQVDNCRKCINHGDCLYQDIALGVYQADYRKQIKAEWIPNRGGGWLCGNCKKYSTGLNPFCSFCGAKMKGGAK